MNAKPPAPPGRVGYGAPPVASRFKTGISGNPSGRPLGAKNLQTMIAEELGKLVTVTESGKQRRIPLARVIAKRLTGQAGGGNLRAVEILLKQGADQNAASHGAADLSEQDEAILQRAVARIRRATSDKKDDDNE
jgi:hypothetical protein